MRSYPKISIVTPNFNGAEYLEETILSVLGQNYPNLEYIIVDGGSTDGSVDIIKKYQDRLAWWISEPDNGMYSAIQKGFDKSTGEIMAWINSDDMYHRKAFYTVAEIFSSFPQVNWLSGANTSYDESGRTIFCNQSRMFTKFDFYNYDYKWIQQESVFWRRYLWEKAGSVMDTKLKYAGDFALWLRFFSFEKLFVSHALIGGFRRRRSGQITVENYEGYIAEIELLLSDMKITASDRTILKRYRNLLFVERIIKKFKFIKTEWMIKRFRKKHFQEGKYIIFERGTARFRLAD
jgi:glycosyltransferase involved in cell wall biosynthesis